MVGEITGSRQLSEDACEGDGLVDGENVAVGVAVAGAEDGPEGCDECVAVAVADGDVNVVGCNPPVHAVNDKTAASTKRFMCDSTRTPGAGYNCETSAGFLVQVRRFPSHITPHPTLRTFTLEAQRSAQITAEAGGASPPRPTKF